MLFGLSFIWGGSFFFNAVLLGQLGPLTIAFGRTSLAAIVLLLVLRYRGIKLPRDPAIWAQFAVMGLLNNLIPFSLIAWGQRSVDSGLASILNATMPLWSVMLAHLMTRDDKLTGNKLIGVLIGLAGVITLIGSDALAGIGDQVWGQLAILAAGLSYALAAIFGRRFRKLPVLVPAAGMLLSTAIFSFPIALLVEQFWRVQLQPSSWLAMFGLAVISTAFAYILYFRLLAEAGVTNTSLVTMLIPLSALLLGVLFLDEQVSPTLILGMLLIIISLVAVDGRLLAKVRLQMRG